jgi:guanine deaminase
MDKKFMSLAIAEAEAGIRSGEGGPFGAVIVKDGVVLGAGHNQVIKNNDPTCHGEIMAIHAACQKIGSFDLAGAEIYTTGYPCPMCLGAILWANIKTVYYGCNVEDTEKIGFRDSAFYELLKEGNKANYIHELSREECLKLYSDYQAIADKKAY